MTWVENAAMVRENRGPSQLATRRPVATSRLVHTDLDTIKEDLAGDSPEQAAGRERRLHARAGNMVVAPPRGALPAIARVGGANDPARTRARPERKSATASAASLPTQ